MSIGSLGIVGGLAAAPLTQRTADVERAEQETAQRTREAKSAEHAEQAAGIGETEEDSEAGERDADGRRPWEHPAPPKERLAEEPPALTETTPVLPKDPTGERGSELDLLG